MKKIFFSAAVCLFSLTAMAQHNDHPSLADSTKRYCAKLMDGLVVVSENGKQLTQVATLGNGTEISMNGIVTKKDGSKLIMKEGDCVDKDGNLVQASTKITGQK